MRNAEVAGGHAHLKTFAAEMFAGLARSDQRAKGALYLRGLLLDGRRKSIRTMARRLGADYQALQQFVTSSTWNVSSVRSRLAQRAVEVVRPVAWVIEDTAFLKEGTGSPCVAKQYAGTVRKVANCQVGVSAHLVGDTGSVAVNWRLSVPESWDETMTANPAERAGIARRRRQCGIPTHERHRPKWAMALEMIAELTEWGLPEAVVVAGAEYGVHDEFLAGLEQLGIRYAVQVEGGFSTTARTTGSETIPLRTHFLAVGRGSRQRVNWWGSTHSSFVVRAEHEFGPVADRSRMPRWLAAEWPDGATEPTGYWVSNLPGVSEPPTLAKLATIRPRIHDDYRELNEVLGLDHFEGRSWIGWNRHVTLVSAAHLFRTALRTRDFQDGGDRDPETSGVA